MVFQLINNCSWRNNLRLESISWTTFTLKLTHTTVKLLIYNITCLLNKLFGFFRYYFSLLNGDSEESVRCSYCSVLNVNENDLRISFENTCTDSLVTAFDDEALLICDQGTEMARAKVLFVLVVQGLSKAMPNIVTSSSESKWEFEIEHWSWLSWLVTHAHCKITHLNSVTFSDIHYYSYIIIKRNLHYLVKQLQFNLSWIIEAAVTAVNRWKKLIDLLRIFFPLSPTSGTLWWCVVVRHSERGANA